MIGGESVKLFDLVAAMHGLRSFAAEYRQAVSINLGGLTVKVLPLQRIIASKRAANRPKDKLVLPVLEDTAATIKAGQRRTKARTVSGKKKRK